MRKCLIYGACAQLLWAAPLWAQPKASFYSSQSPSTYSNEVQAQHWEALAGFCATKPGVAAQQCAQLRGASELATLKERFLKIGLNQALRLETAPVQTAAPKAALFVWTFTPSDATKGLVLIASQGGEKGQIWFVHWTKAYIAEPRRDSSEIKLEPLSVRFPNQVSCAVQAGTPTGGKGAWACYVRDQPANMATDRYERNSAKGPGTAIAGQFAVKGYQWQQTTSQRKSLMLSNRGGHGMHPLDLVSMMDELCTVQLEAIGKRKPDSLQLIPTQAGIVFDEVFLVPNELSARQSACVNLRPLAERARATLTQAMRESPEGFIKMFEQLDESMRAQNMPPAAKAFVDLMMATEAAAKNNRLMMDTTYQRRRHTFAGRWVAKLQPVLNPKQDKDWLAEHDLTVRAEQLAARQAQAEREAQDRERAQALQARIEQDALISRWINESPLCIKEYRAFEDDTSEARLQSSCTATIRLKYCWLTPGGSADWEENAFACDQQAYSEVSIAPKTTVKLPSRPWKRSYSQAPTAVFKVVAACKVKDGESSCELDRN